MSLKAKNLSYEGKEPAFLRRMRGEIGGRDEPGGERSAARLSRRGPVDKAVDDDPTYVLEDSGKTLSKEEYDALVLNKAAPTASDDVKAEPGAAADTADVKAEMKTEAPSQVTDAGQNLKKRKAAKIIKGDDQTEDIRGGTTSQERGASKVKKPKKKAIKLSFDD